jgi:hypothetical protein
MEIYSPKAKQPENFRKNQPKGSNADKFQNKKKEQKKTGETIRSKDHGQLMNNSRVVYTGSTVTYDLRDINGEKKQSELKRNTVVKFFDFLKLKFIDRMKSYFDYEDKYDEKVANKTWLQEKGSNY